MSQEPLVVIPLPLEEGDGVTYAVARLVIEEGRPFADAIGAIPGTVFAPPRRISLSERSLTRIRAGAAVRPDLYLYEGMILQGPRSAGRGTKLS